MEYLGLNLECLGVQSFITSGKFPASEEIKQRHDFIQIPPSLLIPYYNNEPFRIDYTWPPHIRATGK